MTAVAKAVGSRGKAVMESQSGKRSRVLFDSEPARRKKYATVDVAAISASVFMVIGGAFVTVGVVDLALLWTPLRFGTPAWEFATLSQTFSSLPFTGLGLVFVAVGLVGHPSARGLWIKGAAVVFGVLALTLVVLGLLYVTVAPEIVRQTPAEGLDAVGTALVKNGVEILAYTIACAAISLLLWRGVKKVE
jgi:hypothetical protein